MVRRGRYDVPTPPDDSTAAQRTAYLLSLMPDDLKRSGIGVKDFAEFEVRDDCKALLKEITRAVPVRLLLDTSLHKLDDKAKLKASHFFLSTVVDQLQGFLSHRWRANPQETADALMLHFKLRLFIIVILAEWAVGLLLFMTFTPLAIAYLVSVPPFAAVAVFTTKREFILRQVGCMTPAYWFDKATVHQTEPCLTNAGLHLFGYYLKRSRQLVVLFMPEYIERVWCVYELAYWLKHKGSKGIVFIPLTTNAMTMRFLMRFWPKVFTLCAFIMGVATCVAMSAGRTLKDLHRSTGIGAHVWSWPVPAFSVPFILVVAICVNILTAKPRRQRKEVAKNLQQFDVRKTQAFDPSDKEFVLGEIKKWNSSLDDFNRYVQTEVAARLDHLQWRREVEEASVVLLLFLPFFAPWIMGWYMAAGELEPLIWPSMWLDIEAFVTPDNCYCPWLIENCCSINSSWVQTSNSSCADYAVPEVDDMNTSSGCFHRWNFGAAALLASVALGCLVCLIGTCCCSLRWQGVPQRVRRKRSTSCASVGRWYCRADMIVHGSKRTTPGFPGVAKGCKGGKKRTNTRKIIRRRPPTDDP